MNWTNLSLVLVLLKFHDCGILNAQIDNVQIFNQVSPAIAVIKSFDQNQKLLKQANAFVVDSTGILVTNAQVLEGGVHFTVTLPPDETVQVHRILSIEQPPDFALVQVGKSGVKSLKIGNSDSMAVGDTLFAVGGCSGLGNTLSKGRLNGFRAIGDEGYLLEINFPLPRRCRDGILINKEGEVLGLLTLLAGKNQSLNYAVPINMIINRLMQIEQVMTHDMPQPIETPNRRPNSRSPIKLNTAESHQYLLLNIGYSALEAKDYAVAKESFSNVLQTDSTQIDALKGMARAVELSGNPKEALNWYQKVIALDSLDANMYFRCGLMARNVNLDTLALSSYEEALSRQSNFWEAWFEIGLIHGRNNDLQRAYDAFMHADSLKKNNWNILFYLGMTATALGEFANAVDWLTSASEQNPQNADILTKLGMAHFQLDNFTEAREVFTRALELEPKHGQSMLWLAITANAEADTITAKQFAEKAKPVLADSTDKLNCFLLLADIYLKEEAPEKAIVELQQALRIDTNDVRIHELLSRAYLAIGDYKKAKEEYTIIEKLKQFTKK